MRKLIGWACGVALLAVPAAAQMPGGASAAPAPEPACAAIAQPWAGVEAQPSARDAAEAAALTVGAGQAAMLVLHPDAEVDYVTLPKGQGEESSFGGLVTVRIAQAGRYLVGLSEPAWVDVVQGGKPSTTLGFGRGAPCSGIRKGVTFDLAAGDHVLEVSGNLVDRIGVIVLPAQP